MSGEQTHGYDLVIEFAEQAYQELLSAVVETGGFLLGTILGGRGIHLDPATAFSVTVSFDQPAGATDVVNRPRADAVVDRDCGCGFSDPRSQWTVRRLPAASCGSRRGTFTSSWGGLLLLALP